MSASGIVSMNVMKLQQVISNCLGVIAMLLPDSLILTMHLRHRSQADIWSTHTDYSVAKVDLPFRDASQPSPPELHARTRLTHIPDNLGQVRSAGAKVYGYATQRL